MYLANFVDLKKKKNFIRAMYSTNDIFRTIEDDLLICNKFERWHLNLFILFSFHICLIWDLGHTNLKWFNQRKIDFCIDELRQKIVFLYFATLFLCIAQSKKLASRLREKKINVLKNLKVLICLPLLLTISTLIKELL